MDGFALDKVDAFALLNVVYLKKIVIVISAYFTWKVFAYESYLIGYVAETPYSDGWNQVGLGDHF